MYEVLNKSIKNAKTYLGLQEMKKATVAILGQDQSGKSTLLFMLNNKEIVSCYPKTIQYDLDDTKYTLFELGTFKLAMNFIDYVNFDAIIYLVDSSNLPNLSQVEKDLNTLLENKKLSEKPIAIICNKSDLSNSTSLERIKDEINYISIGGRFRAIKILTSSIVKDFGYKDALRWISLNIKF